MDAVSGAIDAGERGRLVRRDVLRIQRGAAVPGGRDLGAVRRRYGALQRIHPELGGDAFELYGLVNYRDGRHYQALADVCRPMMTASSSRCATAVRSGRRVPGRIPRDDAPRRIKVEG